MSQTPSSRRPVLRALMAGAALSTLSLSSLSLAARAARHRVAVHEEEIDPDRYRNNPQTQAFIGTLVAEHNFDRAALDALFAGTAYSATVARLILPPPTPARRSWTAYRGRFIEPVRISAGVQFWQQYGDTLRRAEAEFGVPADVVVGILGVETIYGRDMGNFRVMDALTTLAFDYPDTPNREERSTMFRNQLKDFLLWCRDTGTDAFSVLGSYAGAVGIPQFMPTSIREYALDYDRDGRIDLRNSAVDAIGSVAHFLQMHGWGAQSPGDVEHRGRHRQPGHRSRSGRWPAVSAHDAIQADARRAGPGPWHRCRPRTGDRCARGRSAHPRPADRIPRRPAQFLCADALQPQLLLRRRGIRTGPGGPPSHAGLKPGCAPVRRKQKAQPRLRFLFADACFAQAGNTPVDR
ncbi:hypothetical protein ACEQUB_00842 [Ralstonia syzygii]